MIKNFNRDNGRVLTNREVIKIADQGGVAKCVIRDCYQKEKNGRKVVNRDWEVECICINEILPDGKYRIRIGTQGSVTVDIPDNDAPFRHIVKGRGEVKLYYCAYTDCCGIEP